MTGKSGLDLAHVSRFQGQGSAWGLRTSVTCGQCGSTSSASTALTLLLASKLQEKTALLGSALYKKDLEGIGYAAGGVDMCAAGFGAPHIRQRLYWVAISGSKGLQERVSLSSIQQDPGRAQQREAAIICGETGGLGGLANANGTRRDAWRNATASTRYGDPAQSDGGSGFGSAANGYWRDCDWILCRDEKWRAVEAGTFPLAIGDPARVGRLRAYGNALVAPQAVAFVQSVMEIVDQW
jgi:DNA (cytosine-5)-methyltransferase 1